MVRPDASDLGARFYRRLFELDPTLEPLFLPVDPKAQGEKFVAMLDQIVAALDRPETLTPLLEASGRRHEDYGVRRRDYRTVGEALVWALERHPEALPDPDTRAAWAEAYSIVVALMRRGVRSPG